MKVAFVINKSWNIFNFRRALIKEFQSIGAEVIAIAPYDEYSSKLEVEGCRFIPIEVDSHGLNPFQDLALLVKLYHVYKHEKPDIIIHYTIKPNIYGALAANMLKIPCINNVTGLGTVFLHDKLVHQFAKSLYRFAFRFASKVFFQNPDDLNLFIAQKLVKKHQSKVIPGSGVDTQKFVPSNSFKRNKPFIFLLNARILFDKGILEFIEAAKKMKSAYHADVRFQLIGSHDPNSKQSIPMHLVEQWQESGIIEYLGFVDHITEIIKEADCVVLPSYREGLPKSLIEAMAMGKPIIATNVPGCREVVFDQINGFICEAKDVMSLFFALEKMYLVSDETLQKMGERSRSIVLENFDQKHVNSVYIQTAIELIENQVQK